MEKRTGLPSFYATGVAKILTGDQPCVLESWLKGHYEIDKQPRSSSFATWKIEHTKQLSAEVTRLKGEGWRCTVERFFRLTGTTAILTGKPDIIAQAPDRRPKIIDIKSGQPMDSHAAQVLIYCIAIPLAWGQPYMIFEGELVYPTHRVAIKASEAAAVRPELFALLRRLGDEAQRPDAVPSEANCRFCEVTTADCPDRWIAPADAVDILTSEF